MSDKLLVLITGANQGLGYYAAQQMAATGKYHILLGGRDIGKVEKALVALGEDTSVKVDPKNLEAIQIDIDTDESIQKAAAEVEKKYGYLDILMPNAGISYAQGTTREHYQRVFNTNVFGTAVTIDAFIPLLQKSTKPGGKRIAITGSDYGSLELAKHPKVAQYSAENFPIYRSSKTALSMVMLHYADKLGKEGFVVSSCDPGYCATNLNHHNGLKDPREGAKALIKAATGDNEIVHGWMVRETDDNPAEW